MAYEISGQSDDPRKGAWAKPGSDTHPSKASQESEGAQQADALDEDSKTNPDTLSTHS